MSAYNKVRGKYRGSNEELITKILKIRLDHMKMLT